MKYEQLISGIQSHLDFRGEDIAIKVGRKTMTYDKTGTLTQQIRSCMANSLPQGDGQQTYHIAVCMDRNEYLVPSILAVFMAGYIYVPIDPVTPIDRIKYIADDCDIDLILTTSELTDRLSEAMPGRKCLALDTALASASLPVELTDKREVSDQDVAYIIYTSGTTGQPKGVPITYEKLFSLIDKVNQIETLCLDAESRVLQFVSISFDPSLFTIMGGMYYGCRLIIATTEQRQDVNQLIDLINREKVSFAALPASIISVFPTFDLPSMQALASGGESLPSSIISKATKNGYHFLNFYGPTENTIMSTIKCFDPDTKSSNIGKPLPGVSCYVVNNNMELVEKGEVGELLLGGDQLFNGYLNKEEVNKTVLTANPFQTDSDSSPYLYHTGDLVMELPNGDYEFIGRKDTQVKLRGYRIEYNEIRLRIEECEGVDQCFIRIENIGNQKHLVAYIASKSSDMSPIKEHVKRFLPPYMVPSFFVPVDHFDLTMNGKVDETHLHNSELDKLTAVNRPLNETETEIARILAQVLKLDSINPDIDLVGELSMSSLQIMEAISVLGFTGLQLSVKDFYSQRTIAKLAQIHDRSQQGFWYEKPYKGKPVIVVVSGYTSFYFLYGKWASVVGRYFNIFVIESYHYYHSDKLMSVDDYTNQYLQMVIPIAEEYGLDILTGFCLGGELALYLGQRLNELKGLKPHVIVIDGEVDRDTQPKHVAPLVWKMLPPEINERRVKLDFNLYNTMPNFTYEGRVTSILARNLPPNDVNDENADVSMITDEHRYWMKVFFDRAPEFWKKHYPECTLMLLDIDHYDLLKDMEKGVMPVSNYFIDQIMTTNKLILHNDVEQIELLPDYIDRVVKNIGISPSLSMSLNLALEEAVTNVIMYAYGEGDGIVEIAATIDGDQLTFTIKDSGTPFDPTQKEDADITLGFEERSIGGLGIFLVKQIMDQVEYQWVNGYNILTLTKVLTPNS
jgi:amino acid adenylation domain-containing protein